MCQIREVANQKLLPVIEADQGQCCAPLACEPLPEAGADELAALFKAVADPVRLRLLSLIACHEGGESCVCDLLDAFDMTAPSVSYHLKILREAGPDQLRAARHLGVLPGQPGGDGADVGRARPIVRGGTGNVGGKRVIAWRGGSRPVRRPGQRPRGSRGAGCRTGRGR